jgi:hypothetical protein
VTSQPKAHHDDEITTIYEAKESSREAKKNESEKR